jgi:pyridoxamine 5'-phosphate oxidase
MIAADRNPIELFQEWQREARRSAFAGGAADRGVAARVRRPLWRIVAWIAGGELPEQNAAALATATPDGRPSARMVLVKSASDEGFVFYTNYLSRKAVEIEANPRAALLFHWPWPPRQVRIEGAVSRLSAEESDAYWRSRPRGAQLAAAASEQSAPIADRAALLEKLARIGREHEGRDVPRPLTWGGYRVVPDSIEFWQGQADRLHERVRYRRAARGTPWRGEILQP